MLCVVLGIHTAGARNVLQSEPGGGCTLMLGYGWDRALGLVQLKNGWVNYNVHVVHGVAE